MADNGGVVRQADVLGPVAGGRAAAAVGGGGRGAVLVDNEGALDVDAHRPGVAQCLVDLGRVGGGGARAADRESGGVERRGAIVSGVLAVLLLLLLLLLWELDLDLVASVRRRPGQWWWRAVVRGEGLARHGRVCRRRRRGYEEGRQYLRPGGFRAVFSQKCPSEGISRAGPEPSRSRAYKNWECSELHCTTHPAEFRPRAHFSPGQK